MILLQIIFWENTLKQFYTGIGNRLTPKVLLPVLESLAQTLAKKGYILRSGGAEGADEAFEQGCLKVSGEKEIYLPWASFRSKPLNKDGYFYTREYDYDAYKRAQALAQTFHPAWDRLPDAAKMHHTRNVHQVLGLDVRTPSDFMICYDSAAQSSGTKQAIRVAEHVKIPVFNLHAKEDVPRLINYIKQL